MILVGCSDFQLGAGAAYGTPERPRLADQEAALQALTRVVVDADAELVVFAGDAFQHRRPTVPELLVYRRWVEALPVPLVAVAGNHDVTGPGQPTALEVFGQAGVDVWVAPGLTYVGDGVIVAMLPWAHPATLRAAVGPAQVEEHTDMLLRAAADLYEVARRETVPHHDEVTTVLVTHYALAGVSLPGGLTTADLVGEPVLDPHDLASMGWDWVLAGHVHVAHSTLVEGYDDAEAWGECRVVSIGSPYVCDFGEADLPHGCWVIDTEEQTAEHVPLPDRPFLTYDLHELEGGLWPPVDPRAVDGAVVRVRARVSPEAAAQLDVAELRRQLVGYGAHQVHSVQVDVAREARARAEGLAEDTEPLEALAAWAEAVDLDPGEYTRLRELTVRLLEAGK